MESFLLEIKKALDGSLDGGEIRERLIENEFFMQPLPQAFDGIQIRGIRWSEQERQCRVIREKWGEHPALMNFGIVEVPLVSGFQCLAVGVRSDS